MTRITHTVETCFNRYSTNTAWAILCLVVGVWFFVSFALGMAIVMSVYAAGNALGGAAGASITLGIMFLLTVSVPFVMAKRASV